MSEIGTGQEPREDGHILAAEYVLGLVGTEARAALARRVEEEPAFADAVAFWEAQFAPLADEIVPVPVPPRLWASIESELGRVPVSAAVPAHRRTLWDSLAFWRGVGLLSSGLAVASLATLFLVARPTTGPGDLVAALNQTDGRPSFAAFIDRTTGQVALVPVVDAAAPSDHSHELWIIVPGSAPRSLGIFNASAPAALTLPKNLLSAAGTTAQLAISFEPLGGSPTGLPTGPVVASGALKDI